MTGIKQRDPSVDIIKAFGIFCIVAGHCEWPFSHFISLFHVAVFIIASGYFYKDSYYADRSGAVQFIKRKFVTLWFPYVLWTAVFSILHNFFIQINVYTDNPLFTEYLSGAYIKTTDYWSIADMIKNILKAVLLHGETQIGGALWFLATLMEISIGYCIIGIILNNLFRKDSKKVFAAQWVVSAVFLAIGFVCSKTSHSLAGLDKFFSYYVLFHGGFTVKKYGWSEKERKDSVHVAILVAALVILIVCNRYGSVALNKNSYENPVFLLIVSFTGWQFLYELAFLSQKLLFTKKLFVCIGQNTMAILILHFLCFKIVNCIGVLFNHQPMFLIATFPILYSGGVWWVAYTLAGISIPLCLSLLWKKFKSGIFRKPQAN